MSYVEHTETLGDRPSTSGLDSSTVSTSTWLANSSYLNGVPSSRLSKASATLRSEQSQLTLGEVGRRVGLKARGTPDLSCNSRNAAESSTPLIVSCARRVRDRKSVV